MTGPRTPGEAITVAAQRLAAQRESTKALAEEISRKRQEASQGEPLAEQEGA